MRKWMWSMMLLMVALMVPTRVQADVIWEPEDSFYEAHRNECDYISRRFTANGPDGEVIVYKSPENPGKVAMLENGTRCWINYIYEDGAGISWGIYENSGTGVTGWLPMDYMILLYDQQSFAEEYGEQFGHESGQLDDSIYGKTIYFWNWPGSSEGYTRMYERTGGESLPEYSTIYVDDTGRKWAYIGYHYGHVDKWICLDAPEADFATLYPEGSALEARVMAEQEVAMQEVRERIVPGGGSVWSTVGGLGIAIVLIVVVTLVLLTRLRRRRIITLQKT